MKRDLGIKAKEKLEGYIPQIDEKLAVTWDEEIAAKFGFSKRQTGVVKELLLHTKEHNLRPAKRLRASFVHYGYQLGGGKLDDKIWMAAEAIELVHTALLIHDDIQDKDKIRRGGPTTHEYYQKKFGGDLHFGEAMGINAGDGILCLGFEKLIKSGFESNRVVAAAGQLMRGILNTAFGQSYDVTLEKWHDFTEKDVIVLHRAKTAIYTYENPLFIGGHLAGLPEQVFGILHEYAMAGGVAFQLQDDILGVFGKPEKTGKSADSDLMQGKCTLLVLDVLNKGSASQKQAVEKVWGDWKAEKADLDRARQAIKESGSYEYNKQLAKKYASRAAKAAAGLRDLDLNLEAIDYIQGIAEYMVEREV